MIIYLASFHYFIERKVSEHEHEHDQSNFDVPRRHAMRYGKWLELMIMAKVIKCVLKDVGTN